MEDWIKILVSSGLVGGIVTIATLLLQRRWQKKDKAQDKQDIMMQELSKIDKKVDTLAERLEKEHASNEEYRAKQSRVRILQFNDECIRKVEHTKESFDDVIAEIDAYDNYCQGHPSFPNFKAVAAIANIRRVYNKCCEENSFLR